MADKQNLKAASTLTRRSMLSATALAGASLSLAGTATAASREIPQSWDEDVDVVVIGTGFAGLAAAYEIAKAGASVALLEKMRTPGGNSIINGGYLSAADSPRQAETGIEDSSEQLFQDMMKAGQGLNHVALARVVAEQSASTVAWTIDEIGVVYGGMTQLGGHAVPRSYTTASGSGSGIIVPLLERLKELDVSPRMGTLLKHLIRDTDGRVKGVEVREKYRFPDDSSGTPKTIKARKAVILATGGFGNDVEFRLLQDPRLTEDLDTTNQPGATAEAIREALNIGCVSIHSSWIQLGPWGSPDERGFGVAPSFIIGVSALNGLMVDTQTGKRFVDELADRKTRSDAIIASGNKAIVFCDAPGLAKADESPTVNLDRLFKSGVLEEYATLQDMAAEHDIPMEALQATIDGFNAAVDAGEDPEFGRYMPAGQLKTGQAPFFAVRVAPKIHHTMGGIGINADAQALDVVSGAPIAGLYAAGEVTGGVHGASRLGSCAIADCLVFGRIAGRNAAAEPDWD